MRLFFALISLAVMFGAQSVEVHVTNSVTGADIPGAVVRIIQDGEIVSTGTTGPQGRFRIEALPDGAYTVNYRANGFSRPPDIMRFRIVAGGPPVSLEVKMLPHPNISGHVMDSSGKPVSNADVWVVTADSACVSPWCNPVIAKSKTGDQGEYHAELEATPGTWLVSAAAPGSLALPEKRDGQEFGWAHTFYPNATDPQLAAKIPSTAGAEVWNLDIKLAEVPFHRIRGRILDAHGDPVAKASVLLGTGMAPSLHQQSGTDGTFDFALAGGGEWRITAQLDRDKTRLWGARTIQVKDLDVNDIDVRLAAPFSFRGVLLVAEVPDGQAAAPLPRLPDVMMADTGGPQLEDAARASLGEDDGKGGLVFKAVYPGPHRIGILEAFPGPYYLDSVRLGTADALGSDVLVQPDGEPLKITYRLDGGTVRGAVPDCGSGRVMLLPSDVALTRGAFARSAECGLNGQFEFSSVRPGDYYGIAVANDSVGEVLAGLRDVDALSRRASKVKVRAKEVVTAEIKLSTWP